MNISHMKYITRDNVWFPLLHGKVNIIWSKLGTRPISLEALNMQLLYLFHWRNKIGNFINEWNECNEIIILWVSEIDIIGMTE